MTSLLAILASYLLGSIPFGYVVARARGVDITQLGSGNIGATNVGRILGRRYGMLVFALDFLKGLTSVVAFPRLAGLVGDTGGSWAGELPVLCGFAAIIGHIA